MLILVGVTVTVAINGGLFEKTKEGAKETTIERAKEQITADIATKIADKEGEKITKNDFKKIVEPKYGTIDESGENLILKDKNYTIPLTEIWNDFYEFKLNDHGYYENCIYGTEVYKKYRQYFTEEQQKELDQYLPDFETKMYCGGKEGGVNEKEDVDKWYSSEELLEEEYGEAYFAVFKGTDMYVGYISNAKTVSKYIPDPTTASFPHTSSFSTVVCEKPFLSSGFASRTRIFTRRLSSPISGRSMIRSTF